MECNVRRFDDNEHNSVKIMSKVLLNSNSSLNFVKMPKLEE